MINSPTPPPTGHTWDGTVDDITDRLTTPADGDRWYSLATARALGAISAISRDGLPYDATSEQRLALVARILDALDQAEHQHAINKVKGASRG